MLVTGEVTVPICAHQRDDLSRPRGPAEIIAGSGEPVLDGEAKILRRDGLDVSQQLIGGVGQAVEISSQCEVHNAVLKQQSPSCDYSQIRQKAGLRAMAWPRLS